MSKIKLATIEQICELYPCFTPASLRYRIFTCKENGLYPALRKIGKRVFIDVQQFDKWITKQTY